MSLTRKISQLKKSDDLMPDKTWETTTKHDLLSEIASQNRMTQAQKLTSTEKADFFVMNFLNKVSPSFGKVIAGVIIIMMGSGVSIAAQASVPGQALWSIKRSVIEKVETSLALSPIKETEVHIKHAKERSEEIKKILDDDESTQEKKDKKQKDVTQAALHLEKDITAADSALKIVQEEKNPLEVVELVKKVTDATKEVSESLSEDSSG
ncbi:hypothetical protein HN859_02315, partial [Candidatus Parcubacteria bacterium]|nr:hypothetical protein [Candidatus Parcubacteria bacterium]